MDNKPNKNNDVVEIMGGAEKHTPMMQQYPY